MSNFRNAETDALLEAILSMENTEELYQFLEDVCTIKEIREMAQRFHVARLLSSGQNYQEVNSQTGVSTATICRVNKCLNYGTGGYLTAINRIKKEGQNS